MARTDPQVNVRMAERLKSRLEQAARDNNRSLTAEIAARLEESFEARSVWSDAVAADRLRHERALVGQIEFMKQRAAALGYGVHMALQALRDGRMTDEIKAELAKVEEDADKAIQAAQASMPDQIIKDIRDAQRRAKQLHDLIDSIKDVDF